MKELKNGLAIQGLLMLFLAILGLAKKNKFLRQKQAVLYGILGFASIAASGYINKDYKFELKKRKK